MATYEVDPDGQFAQAIKDALKKVSDLRIPFNLIANSWFKSNKAIFALSGPGKYKDFKNDRSRDQKKTAVGFEYPLLRRSGFLEKSITEKNDPDAIRVVTKTELTLGSSISYGQFHQFGTKFMAARPFVLIGAEQVAPSGINNRHLAWIQQVTDYVLQSCEEVGSVK